MLTNCKIFVAKTAGFCFGVDRAVKIVYNEMDKQDNRGKRIVTLGPIIHNKSVVDDLSSKGVDAVEDLSAIDSNTVVVIRSHGISRETEQALKETGAKLVDATCPFVSRIHKICGDYSAKGFTMLIAGNAKHPEVVGIKSFCSGNSFVFSDEDELCGVLASLGSDTYIAVVSQTTFNKTEWDRLKGIVLDSFPGACVFDTVCDATAKRQEEAVALSESCDMMLVVGGRHSSNTLKLRDICAERCPTELVESYRELSNLNFQGMKFLGISAGASTPAHIIKEVKRTMTEILNDEDFNFEEAVEQSFKKIYIGAKLTGKVTAVNKSEALVDIGVKSTGVIPASEITENPNEKPEDVLKIGDDVDVVVLKTNDQDGIITLSKKRVDAIKGFEELKKSKEEDSVVEGVVVNIVKGGALIATKQGFKVFLPGSQSGLRRGESLEKLLKQEVRFKVLDVDENRTRAVASIRAVEREEREKAKAAFFETAEVGQVKTGTVKSITDYGVFIDLGGLDGLAKKPDLSWKRIKHPSDVVSVGDEVEVTIKSIDKENGKVALSMKKEEDNPWVIFNKNYGVGQVIEAKIVSITSFGAFARIMDGIDGLIHISQISHQRVENVADVLKVGDMVNVKITEIDDERNRISLSIKALLPKEEIKPVKEEPKDDEEEVYTADENGVVYSTDDHIDDAPAEEPAVEPEAEPEAPAEEPAAEPEAEPEAPAEPKPEEAAEE